MHERIQLLESAAKRGKYAPLYHHLKSLRSLEFRTSFTALEAILGFTLPNSARVHRPWWSNSAAGNGHSHALAWQAAGWATEAVDLNGETLTFKRQGEPDTKAATRPNIDLDEAFPRHNPGPWPEGLTFSREEIYGDMGR